jgi:hypothetical protein
MEPLTPCYTKTFRTGRGFETAKKGDCINRVAYLADHVPAAKDTGAFSAILCVLAGHRRQVQHRLWSHHQGLAATSASPIEC